MTAKRGTIDRISDGVAVLVTCTDPPRTITVPASSLPAGSREGDVICMDPDPRGDGGGVSGSGRDPVATADAREKAAALIARLKGRGEKPGSR